jgi:branched-chain amino acid aminotransferase
MKVFIDGKYYTREEAKISVFDHGLLYGDGVFEGIRIYHGRIFKLKEHIRRLFNSANSLSLNIPYNQNQMEELMQEAVKLNEKNEGYIRVLVTRGEGTLGLDPDKCARSIVVIIVDTISMYPEEYYTKGIPIITASSRTIQSDALDPRIKSLNYLNHILATIEAKQAGCMEAVMLNHS